MNWINDVSDAILGSHKGEGAYTARTQGVIARVYQDVHRKGKLGRKMGAAAPWIATIDGKKVGEYGNSALARAAVEQLLPTDVPVQSQAASEAEAEAE
jgi:hypothetical protein